MRQNKREMLRSLVYSNRRFMAERGNSLAGYIAFYCEGFGRTLEYAASLFEADSAFLQKLEAQYARFR